MRVKPVDPTAVIRDPHTRRALPPEGANVPDNSFWRRRLASGEVVLVKETEVRAPLGIEPIAPLTTRDVRGGK